MLHLVRAGLADNALISICLQNCSIYDDNFIEHCTKHVGPNHQAMLTAETYSTTNFIDIPQTYTAMCEIGVLSSNT
jgi:hypothetical protein